VEIRLHVLILRCAVLGHRS